MRQYSALCNEPAVQPALLTIHFGPLHIYRPHARLGLFLKRAGDWLRKRNGNPPAYVWVLENPHARNSAGAASTPTSSHSCSPIAPCRRTLTDVSRAWLVGPGNAAPQGAIKIKPVYYSGLADSPADYLEHGLLGSLRYFLKGLEEEHAGLLGSEAKPQGETLGKRCGYSEALGRQHRWKRIPVGGRAWVGGPDVKMKHWVRHHFPELLGLAD